MLLGVDVGGTFTDAVLLDDGAVHAAKVPTTPGDESAGVMRAIGEVLARAGASAGDIAAFSHGMTVGTNALLEERGARTALIATRGFADLLEIGRQDRPELYRLCKPKPAPLVEPALRLEADERIGPDGIVAPLGEDEPERLAELLRERGAESIAVCLLFSYLDPSHERRLAEHLRARLPGVHVSASHEVLPRFREYERCSTTTIDAYLSPLLGRYLGRLAEAAEESGLPPPLVMQSPWRGAPPAATPRGPPRRRAGGAGGRLGRQLAGPRAAGGGGGSRPRRQPGDGEGAAGRHRRARDRPPWLRPASVRRRRPDARRRNRRRAGDRDDPLPARQRRPLGPRPLRLRPPPRHDPHRDAERRRSQRRAHRGRGRGPDRRGRRLPRRC